MSGALAGLRVVELGEMVSAPYAAKLMADLGAEVIKVERPTIGDPARRRGPFPGDRPHLDKSGLFLYLNSNKLGVTLDPSCPAGFKILEQLAANADVLIHDLPPAEMDRIGLDFDRIAAINPRLVMTSVEPFGLSGPCRDWRSSELTLWASGGAIYINGSAAEPEMPPLKAYGYQAGYQGGAHAAVATMGALFAGVRGAGGQHVEVSIQESVASITELAFQCWPYLGLIATRFGQRPVQPLESFECRDGWIFVCCVEEHQWRNFVKIMDSPDWTDESIFVDGPSRAANWDALRLLLKEWIANQSVDDLYRKAQARRVPFAPVSHLGDLLDSPHLKARGFFVEIAHPIAGELRYPGAPYHLERTPWAIRRPAPTLGQHNDEIYSGRLGLSAMEIDRLRDEAVI